MGRCGLLLGPLLLLLAGSETATSQDVAGGELPPPGYGSLKQDFVSLRVGSSSDLEVRFLPLDERLLRLLAPDAYESLHGLVVSRQTAIDSAAREAAVSAPGLALVTFFALRPDARFDPQNVSLSYRNQFYRPVAIIPFTGNFTSRQLDVRQQASGILLFDTPVPVYERFDVVYGSAQASWSTDILQRIERERSRVQRKWQAEQGDSTKSER